MGRAMDTMRFPKTRETIGPPARPDAIYLRFEEGIPVGSIQPDPRRFVFLEVAQSGRLIGVLTYEPVHVLLVESVAPDVVFDASGQPSGVDDRFRYEARFIDDEQLMPVVQVDTGPCCV